MLAQPVVCTSICSDGDGAYKRYWLLMRRGGGPASQWPPPRAHYGGQHFAWLHLHRAAPQHSTRPHLALHSPEQLYCESETVAVCAHWQGDAISILNIPRPSQKTNLFLYLHSTSQTSTTCFGLRTDHMVSDFQLTIKLHHQKTSIKFTFCENITFTFCQK